MAREKIYLDNHATTKPAPEAVAAMVDCLENHYGNAASNHAFGHKADRLVESARAYMAGIIAASSDEIVFTSGATESNNQALKGCVEALPEGKRHVIVSAVEHKCVLEAAAHLKGMGVEVTLLPVGEDCRVDPQALEDAICPDTGLVSIMYANNEVGAINPIGELGEICKRHGIIFHVDAAQAVTHVGINVKKENIDLLSSSGHKFHGPKGVGFLYVSKDLPVVLPSLLDGGSQERGFRSGTVNVPGVVGMHAAAEVAVNGVTEDFRYVRELRKELFIGLKNAVPGLHLNGPDIDDTPADARGYTRLPHNLNVSLDDGIPAVDIIGRMRGVAVSAGSACRSSDHGASYVLKAMGVKPEHAISAIRFGLSRYNTPEEISAAVEKYASTVSKLRG